MTDEMLMLALPFPPSVNSHWQRARGGGVFVSAESRRFRKAVQDALWAMYGLKYPRFTGPVELSMQLQRGDRRRYDADNFVKETQDALAAAGVLKDDTQVWRLVVEKLEPKPKDPRCFVIVREYPE